MAVVQIHEIPIDFRNLGQSLKKLQNFKKKEAFIYYFQHEEELTSEYYNVIENIQENYNPEISLLFLNGKAQLFKKPVETIIEKLVSNYFIEYLKEDLTEFQESLQKLESEPLQDKNQAKIHNQGFKGGLLNGDEKVGIERLIECMHCCMWSNMNKKTHQQNAVPQSLLNDLEKQAQEKRDFLTQEQQKLLQKPQSDQQEESKELQSPPKDSTQAQTKVIDLTNDDLSTQLQSQLLIEEDHYIKNVPLMSLNPDEKIDFTDDYEMTKEELEAESMMMLMQQFKNMKETTGGLNDEERRKQAEDMILKLAKYMQLEDDEEEDVFDGEEDEDDMEGYQKMNE
eukprot:403352399